MSLANYRVVTVLMLRTLGNKLRYCKRGIQKHNIVLHTELKRRCLGPHYLTLCTSIIHRHERVKGRIHELNCTLGRTILRTLAVSTAVLRGKEVVRDQSPILTHTHFIVNKYHIENQSN